MKFVLICMIAFTSFAIMNKNKTYSDTGHEQFSEIEFADENCFLINSLSKEEIDKDLKGLKAKAFGKREELYLDKAKATYVSTVIFSRSNKTREEYTFTYDTSMVTYKKTSLTIKGSLTSKTVLKNKTNGLEETITGDIGAAYATETSSKYTENGKMSVVIYPYKKVSLRISGDCLVTNGISKVFVFGICVKKGAWEIVEVVSTCFELIEEDV